MARPGDPIACAGAPRPVLHLIDTMDCGGAQELLVLLARVTPRDRYPTSVAVIQPFTGMADQLRAAGARVHLLNRARPSIMCPVRMARYVWGVVNDVRRICLRENISILHCHLSDAEFTGILAGRLAGVPSILDTVHTPRLIPERYARDVRTILRKLLVPAMLNRADWIIAVSNETGKALGALGVDPARIRVVENGIDVEAFGKTPDPRLRDELGIAPGDATLATIARLTMQKGHEFLIAAMPSILERRPDARLLLLGEGELRETLETQARSLGVSGRVSFLGVRSDIPDVLALTDVFVLPSLWEGTSLALLEAMAAGKPIVATDIDGNRPLLKDRRDCLLVPPGDPAPLADAIVTMLDDRVLTCQLGETARRECRDRFDIRAMFRTYESLWNSSALRCGRRR
jgi:glycosyltransferase involved in cell wall biosynthesis